MCRTVVKGVGAEDTGGTYATVPPVVEEEGDEDTAGTDGDDESEEEPAGTAATPGLVLIKEPPKRDPR